MSIFKKLKYTLGLNQDDEDDVVIADDPDTGDSPFATPAPAENVNSADDEQMQTRIFEHVVEVFNSALPDFLGKSVDPAAQRKFLYDTLHADLKAYVDNIGASVRREFEKNWQADKQTMQEKMKDLETRAREVELRRSELSQKQLSTDRQRRALSDRVHDLEKQVLNLEAEREQYQLESKSLMNKLKVSGVHEDENEKLRQEITELQAELNAQRAQNLKQKAAGAEPTPAQDDEATRKEMEALRKELATVNADLAKANDDLAKANADLGDVHAKLDKANAEIANGVSAEQLHELEEQLARFEEVKANKDARIAELRKTESQLSQENEKLRKQLKQLSEQQPEKDNRPETPRREKHSKHKPAAAAPIDDILSDTDWLVSPNALKQNKQSGRDNQQRRKDTPPNPDQMSLF